MKKETHPKYVETTVTCGCGSTFMTRSTQEKIGVEICSACHPFFTGQTKYIDTAGRIEKFQRKWGSVAEKLSATAKNPAAKPAKSPS
ncbi:MAG TPA: 50S ribosomal protein L31 [Planctomycetota bacterium]|nr:50S ribosomal protein L31 [Planctomycetota bacterium]